MTDTDKPDFAAADERAKAWVSWTDGLPMEHHREDRNLARAYLARTTVTDGMVEAALDAGLTAWLDNNVRVDGRVRGVRNAIRAILTAALHAGRRA